MNLRLDLPPELLDEIVAAVAARVLAELLQAAPATELSPYLTVE